MNTIVLVDDELGIAEGIQYLLEKSGMDIKVTGIAGDGCEGMKMILTQTPDIVISDVRMPIMDGLEMIQELMEKKISSRFIMLSGYSEFAYAKQAMRLGVKHYICKPVEIDELYEVIREVCEEINSERITQHKMQHLENVEKEHQRDHMELQIRRLLDGEFDSVLVSEEQKTDATYVKEIDIQRLEHYMMNNNLAGCHQVIHHIFCGLKSIYERGNLTTSALQTQSLNIVLSGLRTIPLMQFQLSEYLGKNILNMEGISKFQSIEQLENWVINTFSSILEVKAQDRTGKNVDVITKIKEYIQDNYTKEISLNDIAGKFYLNPYYLSQLFKKKTGMTYQNYVTRLRIEKAKILLLEGKRVYEVCELVGYSDSTYFSRIFEKLVGYKPSEYRRKELGE